ncbi:MAG TPA: DUF1573 domain-containing protein [Candidatus Hydrogenedentes bacterium]|nr:DUF1573 domain-containing protein [Candidatus Hydrogenedentota bacterium]
MVAVSFLRVTRFILLVALGAMPAMAGAKAVLGIEKLDFGTVLRGDVAVSSVPVRNDGDAPFGIIKVNSSCPCVIVEAPTGEKAVVQPGTTYDLPVRYDSKDRIGPQGAVIAIMTDDPENPALTLDVTAFVESLVVVRPPNGIVWGYVPRGNSLNKTLEFAPGNTKNDIELIEISVSHPSVTIATEKKSRGEERFISVSFTIAKDAPLGIIEAQLDARVRVAGEEAQISAPFRGEVIGDVLVSPPAIISPKTAYTLGQRISEITVQPSQSGGTLPKLLGAMATGSVKAFIVESTDDNKHTIAVHAGDNVGAGPQSGVVHVMTDSADQSITSIPVYFRMGASVVAKPESASIRERGKQVVSIARAQGGAMKITNVGFEEDIVAVTIVQAESADPTAPASIEIAPKSPANPDRLSTIVVIETDAPGGARIHVPVAIFPE